MRSLSTGPSLFVGPILRWRALSTAEQVICSLIVLIPLWWVLGLIPYLIFCVAAGVVLHERIYQKKIRLRRPTLAVLCLTSFYLYSSGATLYRYFHFDPASLDSLTSAADLAQKPLKFIDLIESLLQLSFPFLLWYCQSHNIRIRMNVLAWALSVVVLEMLAVCLFCHFVLGNPFYDAPQTLWAILKGKSGGYNRSGEFDKTNFLLLYWPTEKSIGAFPRFYGFFNEPQAFAKFMAVSGLIAFSLRNRLWKFIGLAICIFLIGVSGSRSIWLSFPVAVLIGTVLKTRRLGGVYFTLALLAGLSFMLLCMPPVTNLVMDTTSNTASFVSDFRENSTENRASLYQGAIEAALDNPTNFLLGHPENSWFATHSFILGELLYRRGLVGAGLFLSFDITFLLWLKGKGTSTPLCSFLILLLLNLSFVVTVFGQLSAWFYLLSAVISNPISLSSDQRQIKCANY